MKQAQFDKTVALVNVDLTNDFVLPTGALYVNKGEEVIDPVNALRENFQTIVWTKEEHDKHHDFFASSRDGKKPLDTVETEFGTQFLWPDHCITGSFGAQFYKDLIVKDEDMVVIKGTDPTIHAYSAVYMDDRKTIIRYPDGKTMPEKLREKGIQTAVVTGLAYDFCAGMTAYDLAKEGFNVILLRDVTHSINIPLGEGKSTVTIMDDMLAEAGVMVTRKDELLQTLTAENINNPQPTPCM